MVCQVHLQHSLPAPARSHNRGVLLLPPRASGVPGLPWGRGTPPGKGAFCRLAWDWGCLMLRQWIRQAQRQDFGTWGDQPGGGGWLPVHRGRVPAPAAVPAPGSKRGVSPWGGSDGGTPSSRPAIPMAGERKTRLWCWWSEVGLGMVACVLQPAPCPRSGSSSLRWSVPPVSQGQLHQLCFAAALELHGCHSSLPRWAAWVFLREQKNKQWKL